MIYYKDENITIHHGDCREILPELEAESVQCVVTSPPYWGLRDYGIVPSVWGGEKDCKHEYTEVIKPAQNGMIYSEMQDRREGGSLNEMSATRKANRSDMCIRCGAWRGCLGLEPTPEMYVEHIVGIFRQVWRVLRKDGTVWLNMGDSYAGSWGAMGYKGDSIFAHKNGINDNGKVGRPVTSFLSGDLKNKDLVGIPWILAFALRADGWWLRQDIIWSKPNPKPERTKDRPTRSHEYLFLLTKAARYYYDAEAIAEDIKESSFKRIMQPNFDNQTGGEKDYSNGINPNRSARNSCENFAKKQRKPDRWAKGKGSHSTLEWSRIDREGRNSMMHFDRDPQHSPERKKRKHDGEKTENDGSKIRNHSGNSLNLPSGKRNKRSVWEIAPSPFPGNHFATFPPDLVKPCILAGSREGDIVLDPFGGSGTVAMVAEQYGRKAISIEIKSEYCEMQMRRCRQKVFDFNEK